MKIQILLGTIAAGAVLATSLGFAWKSQGAANTAVAAAAPLITQAAPTQAAQAFTVDGVHSSLIFKVQHMGLTNFYGRFNKLTGTYTLDGANSSFNFEVATDSVDTANEGRNKHLKSPDFFNAVEYPTLSFKSTKVEPAGENTLRATGDLTLHGVTKPIAVDINYTPAKQTRQGLKSGFETSFTIKRSDYGMSYGVAEGGLGDAVTVIVAVEGASG